MLSLILSFFIGAAVGAVLGFYYCAYVIAEHAQRAVGREKTREFLRSIGLLSKE